MAVEPAGPPLIRVEGLELVFPSAAGWRVAVDRVGFELEAGGRLGLVGESGSGKSALALACLGLVTPPGRIRAGRVVVGGSDLTTARPTRLSRVRGGVIGLVMQEPAAALNPVYTVGFQLVETIRAHRGLRRADARAAAVDLLHSVQLAEGPELLAAYPHQLSGGQAQRVLIALALAGEPRALVADEPTTALDVTTQAAVLRLLDRLCRERGMALLLVSHDLAVVAGMVDRVMVMLAGEVVEEAPVADLLRRPLHPFTRELVGARPGMAVETEIAPQATADGTGCRYAPRCPLAEEGCRERHPELERVAPGRLLRCPVVGRSEGS